MRIKIINGNIFRPDNKFHKGNVEISDGIIINETHENSGIETIDAENKFIIPALTDIHFHGCNGHDFCEGTQEALQAISDYENSVGVLTICPATMTLPVEKLKNIMISAKEFSGHNTNLAGIYLEGPFISEHKIGAQNPKYIIKPDVEILKTLQKLSGGSIKIAVIAPEVENGLEFIEQAKVITKLSIGHTVSNYETAKKAFNSGVTQATHLFNAMTPINHREPGVIIAAFENNNVNVEIICDGVHLHSAIVRNVLKVFGSDRVIFISDSMEATGKPDGEYELGGQKVIKTGNRALLENGTIAGSVTNLFDCMKKSVLEMGVEFETAIKCSAVNPVKALEIYDKQGSIEAGKLAKILILDKNLNIVYPSTVARFPSP
ncbi:MAG: N-acetylglucosamine-6-phosphate deacetylase [Synergistaceae bacterium]|nr:N-acetylglucosamine-6-phosphate deacetylase [Synergistaceae bacterium]